MQLKLQRSQREAGITGKNIVFCLDARAELTPEERANLSRYKLYDQVIYNSRAAAEHLEKSVAHTQGGGAGNFLKGMAHLAMTALNLNVTVKSLERGQHIECKSMDELLGAEEAIMDACRNLRSYLETASTFDGREVVVDFSTAEPRLVAQSIHPEPVLAAPAAAFAPEAPLLPGPAPVERHGYEDAFASSDGYAASAYGGGKLDLWEIWSRLTPQQKAGAVVAALILLLFLRSFLR